MAGVLVQRDYDAILCLGAVIRGETLHFDYIAHAVARSLADLGIQHGKPVLFGVLTTDTVEQAMERSGGGQGNRGADAASGALEMVNLLRQPKND
jgi:6,7-dimethyl-8-ribityllumazine synthase